jgi:hypothetical protein
MHPASRSWPRRPMRSRSPARTPAPPGCLRAPGGSPSGSPTPPAPARRWRATRWPRPHGEHRRARRGSRRASPIVDHHAKVTSWRARAVLMRASRPETSQRGSHGR